MNKYEELQDIFYQTIEEKCHGIYKQKAFFHSLQVAALCQRFALEKGLDIELAGIMGLFHDYAQFMNHSSFDHALRSRDMIIPLLKQFDEEEKNIILTAIAHHSDKGRIDDEYSEILKDADVLAQYLQEPHRIMKEEYNQRLKKYL